MQNNSKWGENVENIQEPEREVLSPSKKIEEKVFEAENNRFCYDAKNSTNDFFK
jgi:hypothetical protein